MGGVLGGVVDFDGIVDKIEILYYLEMGRMGLIDLFGFLIEFWLRLCVMFVNLILVVLFFKLL